MITQTQQINIQELHHILEPLIRRVVREELVKVIKNSDIFYLKPHMPLYEDMEDIQQRKEKGTIELFSHEEVWGE